MRSDLDAVDDAVAVSRYRILQEALTNIAKYVEAHSVGIDRETRDSNGREALRLRVPDERKSFDATNIDVPGRRITGMRDRTLAMGGTFEIASQVG